MKHALVLIVCWPLTPLLIICFATKGLLEEAFFERQRNIMESERKKRELQRCFTGSHKWDNCKCSICGTVEHKWRAIGDSFSSCGGTDYYNIHKQGQIG